jgi:plastocyanin
MRSKLSGLMLAVLVAGPAFAGDVKGTIHFKGTPPALPPLKVTTDMNHCGQTVPNELVVVSSGHLENVVVTVEVSGTPKPPPQKVVVDQFGCQYHPHVQVAPAGSTLEIKNSDPMLHNIHGRLGQLTVFNVAMPVKGMVISKQLAKDGVVHVKCDVHTWMEAWVIVTDQPSAVDGKDGTYVIKNVPPGTYPLTAWHEKYGKQTQQVTVPAAGDAKMDFTFGG